MSMKLEDLLLKENPSEVESKPKVKKAKPVFAVEYQNSTDFAISKTIGDRKVVFVCLVSKNQFYIKNGKKTEPINQKNLSTFSKNIDSVSLSKPQWITGFYLDREIDAKAFCDFVKNSEMREKIFKKNVFFDIGIFPGDFVDFSLDPELLTSLKKAVMKRFDCTENEAWKMLALNRLPKNPAGQKASFSIDIFNSLKYFKDAFGLKEAIKMFVTSLNTKIRIPNAAEMYSILVSTESKIYEKEKLSYMKSDKYIWFPNIFSSVFGQRYAVKTPDNLNGVILRKHDPDKLIDFMFYKSIRQGYDYETWTGRDKFIDDYILYLGQTELIENKPVANLYPDNLVSNAMKFIVAHNRLLPVWTECEHDFDHENVEKKSDYKPENSKWQIDELDTSDKILKATNKNEVFNEFILRLVCRDGYRVFLIDQIEDKTPESAVIILIDKNNDVKELLGYHYKTISKEQTDFVKQWASKIGLGVKL